MAKATMTGTQVFEEVAETTGLKTKDVRGVIYAVAELAGKTLKKTGVFRVPHLGKFVVKKYPARHIKAGPYLNPFTKETVNREAKTIPPRTKVRAYAASQVKNLVIPSSN